MLDRLYRTLVLSMAGIALCSSAPSQTEKRQEPSGQIYVYANWELLVHKWVDITCDDEVVAKVKAGRFFVINLPPGRHVVSERDGLPAFIEVRPGEKSFVRLDREVDGQTVMLVLTKMNSNEAGKEIVHLAYIDATKSVSDAVAKQDPRDLRHPELKTRAGKD